MKGRALPLETMWKARQLYEERWTEADKMTHPVVHVGERKWSMRQIAVHLGISETSVLRAVSNTGRFAVMGNAPLPEVQTDAMMAERATESLKKLQAMIAAEKDEQTPGQTKADKVLAELEGKGLEVTDNVKDKMKGYL